MAKTPPRSPDPDQRLLPMDMPVTSPIDAVGGVSVAVKVRRPRHPGQFGPAMPANSIPALIDALRLALTVAEGLLPEGANGKAE